MASQGCDYAAPEPYCQLRLHWSLSLQPRSLEPGGHSPLLVPINIKRPLEGGGRPFLARVVDDDDLPEAAALQLPCLLHRLLVRPTGKGHGPARRIDPLHFEHDILSASERDIGLLNSDHRRLRARQRQTVHAARYDAEAYSARELRCESRTIQARSDDEAKAIASTLPNGHGIDLWERARYLASYPPRSAAYPKR